MRYVDAPPRGWYPDPESRTSLRWWDGLDWADIRRAPPSGAELLAAEDTRSFAFVAPPTPGAGRSGVPAPALSLQDSAQLVNEVRMAARQELDRAALEFSNRATNAVRSFTPLVTEYTSKLLRWVRRAVIVAIVLLVAYFIFQVVAQASLFEWIGDRIDNLDESGLAATSP